MATPTILYLDKMIMPAGNMGQENPLIPLLVKTSKNRGIKYDNTVTAENARYLGYGLDIGIAPYRIQDNYDRQRENRKFNIAVLENEILRATFLLDYGGRLWSLWHKLQNKELLYRNPIFQPANLALRNAWFSGGVEWNVGMRGHTPLTCSPLFAARVQATDGSPILRMYEWERVRKVPYQLDFSLPAGSPWLFVRIRLTNPNPNVTPNYWWSNIAVPETPETRVLAPADAAFTHGYQGGITRVTLPILDERNITYPTQNSSARDIFFEIPDGQRYWVTALDSSGKGLIQVSTTKQQGRKLFVWGMSPGGRRWQEFLSVPNQPYVEIQAGVARTQYECFPMQPGEEIAWLEAYGLMEANPERVHGSDWTAAWQEVDRQLERKLPKTWMEEELLHTAFTADQSPNELLHMGSGWGVLEQTRRKKKGEPPLNSKALLFPPESIGQEQAPWKALLEEGALPEPNPCEIPVSWMVQDEWRQLLEQALQEGRGDHWYSWLHLGNMRYHAGDMLGARQAWKRSVEYRPSPWVLRNQAIQAIADNNKQLAADLYLQAYVMAPDQVSLAVECIQALINAGEAAKVSCLLESAPSQVMLHGRVQVLTAKAALELGELDKAEGILLSGIEVPDLREGELMLSELWYAIQEQRIARAEHLPVDETLKKRVRENFTPPKQIDFRMHG